MWKNNFLVYKKGQASLVDIVILGTAISFVLIAGTYMNSQQEIAIQNNRFISMYSQAQLMNILKFRTDFQANTGLIKNASIADLSMVYFCSPGSIDNNTLANIIKYNIISYEAPKKYNYIYYSTDGTYILTAYNNQPTVCGKHIPLALYTAKVICIDNTIREIRYYFGMWPEWKKYPTTC